MKILRKGRRYEYNGPRDADGKNSRLPVDEGFRFSCCGVLGIVKFMKEQSKPASTEWKSVRDAQKNLSQKDVSIVGFFESPDSETLESFKEAGNSFSSSVARKLRVLMISPHRRGITRRLQYFRLHFRSQSSRTSESLVWTDSHLLSGAILVEI